MPNELLEETETLLTVDAPDCLALVEGLPVVSSRSKVLDVDNQGKEIAGFDSEITCMVGLLNGGLAVGLLDGRIAIVKGPEDGKIIEPENGAGCLTAMCADSGNTLWVTHGSSTSSYSEWKRDLMEKNACGSVWRVELSTGSRSRLCGDLAFPYGIIYEDQVLVVAESWRSRLVKIDTDGRRPPTEILGQIPGYVSRMAPARTGGAWLTVFAPRSQLVEFVLRETRYCRRMMKTIDSDYWLAPALRSNRSLYEPLQAGGVKQLGIMKPWSPARSYGLVIRLDGHFQPVASLHSRAGRVKTRNHKLPGT